MASQEELNREKEINDLRNERIGIERGVLNNLQEQNNITADIVSQLRFERSERSEIRSITRDLNKIAQNNYDLTLSNIGSLKSTLKIENDRESALKRKRRLEDLSQKFLEDSLTLTGKEQEKRFDLAVSLEQQAKQAEILAAELEIVAEESEKIADNLAVKGFNITEDIIGAIPGLRQFKGTFTDAANSAKAIAAGGGTSAEAFAAGAKSISSAAKAALPLLIFSELIKTFIQLDNSSGKIAKNLGISYQQSLKLQGSFSTIASGTNNIFLTTQELSKAFVDINNSLGTNAQINEDLLKTQVELVKQAGYSVEAANEISRLSLATGQSSEDITTEFLGQAKLLNLQNNLAINEKTLLNDIQNISKGTLATFAGQVDELAEASFKARQLGLELKQLEGIADGLLDIESSLAAEFEAEVISGKQINLERARFFALTNDIASLAEEIGKNEEVINAFSSGTRIEQEAIAKSLGLSRDELGDMVIERKAINQLQGIEGKTSQERFNNLVKEVGLEEAKRRLGDETLANQLQSVSVQEKFQQTIAKLQDVFVKLALPLMPIVDAFMDIFGIVVPLIRLFDPLIQAVRVIAAGVADIVTAFTNLITLNFSGLSSFGSNISTAFTQGSESIAQSYGLVEDGIAPSSKGPFTITDSYGATAITAKGDGLAVSPNIQREGRNTPTSVVLSDAQIQKIANAVRDGASKATINLDGNRVSSRLQTPMVLNNLPPV